MVLFTCLLEGNANVHGCGSLTLPSGTDLDGAPQEIKDRLNAITSIDLSEDTVGFKVTGDALHPHAGLQHSNKNHEHVGSLDDRIQMVLIMHALPQLTHRGRIILRVQPRSTSRAVTSQVRGIHELRVRS